MYRFFKKFDVPRFLAALALLCLSAKLMAQDTVRLTGKWKIQPAANVKTLPADGNWGTTDMIDARSNWLWETGNGQGTTWASTPPDSVNSLWFEKAFTVPAAWSGRRIAVNFRRIEGDAIVFCNGTRVAELLRPGGEVELSGFIKMGKENKLQVFVTRNYTDISRGFVNDPLRYQVRQLNTNTRAAVSKWPMGITAAVNIISRPQQAITFVNCIPSYRKKALFLQVEVDAAQLSGNYQLEANVVDASGKEALNIAPSNVNLITGVKTYTISANWTNPIYWELDRPYSYKVNVRLKRNGTVVSAFNNQTLGFRELWTKGKDLYMNGHLSRWRITDLYSANDKALSFYRLMGYNVGQVQPASHLWWTGSGQAEAPMMNEAILNEADKLGMGITLPGPSVSTVRGMILSSPQARIDYEREAAWYIRHYGNHPCILAWVVSMNSVNPKANIWPQFMGKADTTFSTQARVIQQAYHLVKHVDSTRLVFSHADGSEGDVSTANVYLNFVPLQEREEWPLEWAKNGNMPYSAVEFGTPYWNNFWRGKQFFLTEFIASYLGDDAYRREQPGALKQTIGLGIGPLNGTWEKLNFTQYPAFWQFQRLFTHNSTRAWRTWGINAGWLNWLLEGYGDPPGFKGRWTDRYKVFTEPVAARPNWVNPRFDIFSEDNHPLLGYIAGAPVTTDKTHTFFSGEKVSKQISVVWDGWFDQKISINWQLKQQEKMLKQQAQTVNIAAGSNNLYPLTFTAPAVSQRTAFQLFLTVKSEKGELLRDTFQLDIFPVKPAPLARVAPNVVMFDPAGKTIAWVKKLNLNVIAWQKGMRLSRGQVLVIGSEALRPGMAMPYTTSDVAAGLKVIVMAQQPLVWEGLGFKTVENMPRYVFIRDRQNPILSGLYPRDFINWRGTPYLLPEGKLAREYDTEHAPKWTNRHAVASVVLRTPDVAGFTPVLQAEFDMAYSPLLEWNYGKGRVTFCSLDLTDRIGTDPVATLLARQLLKAQQSTLNNSDKVFYTGDEAGGSVVEQLQLPLATSDAAGVWVIGNHSKFSYAKLKAHLAKGGSVVWLPQDRAQLAKYGFTAKMREFVKTDQSEISEPLLRAVGPNLLRWRDTMQLAAFEKKGQPANCRVLLDGLMLIQQAGKGQNIYLQVSPAMMARKYADDAERKEAVQTSVLRLNQLYARIFTNLGVSCNVQAANNLVTVNAPADYQTLGNWRIMGPYLPESAEGKAVIETVYPGEQDAIDGAENPNLTYKRPDGKQLDWRGVVDADKSGFVDLAKYYGGKDENAVAYVTKTVNSPTDRQATLKLGVDFWMNAWVNGKPVLKVINAHQKRANEYVLIVPLKKGENIITLKVGSGRGGFGFWASLSKTDGAGGAAEAVRESKPLYVPLFKDFDPYQFNYW